MAHLTLLRHGESMWNKKNLFTGWVDVPLSNTGIREAETAGKSFETAHFDAVFTSTLIRAIMTAMIALAQGNRKETPVIIHEEPRSLLHAWGTIYSEKTEQEILPVYLSDALNERMYGELQGLNKQETRDRFGDEQVHIWRRSFNVCPPEGESLEKTMQRALPYFHTRIFPLLRENKNVLISAHGNSLRAIIKEIEAVSDADISSYELQTGVPIEYLFDGSKFIKKSQNEPIS